MALLAAIFLASDNALSETDPYIDEVLYSIGSTESKVLVQSGRDNATFYKYLILDDYSEAPENWSQSDFNDSAWSLGSAPFGIPLAPSSGYFCVSANVGSLEVSFAIIPIPI